MVEVSVVTWHRRLLADLTRECPNTICIRESPHPIKCYRCLEHVLEFAENSTYIGVRSCEIDDINAGPLFAHWLIDKNILVELSRAKAGDSDFVFYFNKGTWKHAGLWSRYGRVISKWGQGHLYEHELFEVPMSFGNNVKYYRRLPCDDAIALFLRYAIEKNEEMGGSLIPKSLLGEDDNC